MKTQHDHTYSRREFGKLALAGVPAALVLARAGLSAADSKINGVRIGAQSYSFREMSLDDALKAYQEIGIGECELFSGHIEPRPPRPAGPPPAPGTPRPAPDPAIRENLRKFRLETPLDHFTAIKKKFDAAGVKLQAYNLSFNETLHRRGDRPRLPDRQGARRRLHHRVVHGRCRRRRWRRSPTSTRCSWRCTITRT